MEKKENEEIINKNKITEAHLNNLDEFIQKCLDNFKFVDPKPELYDSTGPDKNIIISHKSTIPDLVIWNKTFNKNNCFIGADTNKETKFPRYLFYIKIKKSKKIKKNNPENKNSINTNNNFDATYFENDKHENNTIGVNNMNNNIMSNNIINNNINMINKKYKKIEEKNKFSMNPEQNLENNLNNINKIINLTTYLIQLYLYKDGWIILTNDNFSGPGTSINLYQFLQEKIKENCNLDNFVIIDINKQVKFTGNNFYNILSNILQKILQKKQMELIKFEEIMNKQFKISNKNNSNVNNNENSEIYNLQEKINSMSINVNNNQKQMNNNSNNNININLYSNQIFPGVNYIGNINNNISNANFIQNNITNYHINQYSNNKKKIQSNDENIKKK
jgi:hypothetical protein